MIDFDETDSELTSRLQTGTFCHMKRLIIAIVSLSGSALAQMPADPKPSNLSYRLESLTGDADAHNYCPSRRRDRYTADFKKRYGGRIDRLKSVHLARSGPDASFIVLSSCQVSVASAAEQDARHRKAMDDFEGTLRSLEREFGNY